MNCKTFKSLKKDSFEFAYYSSEVAERHVTLWVADYHSFVLFQNSHACAYRAAMHQAALVAFNKMVAKHRENLIHYRKAMAAFILKTEVSHPCLIHFWARLVTFSIECGRFRSSQVPFNWSYQHHFTLSDSTTTLCEYYSNATLVPIDDCCPWFENHASGLANCSTQTCKLVANVILVYFILSHELRKTEPAN